MQAASKHNVPCLVVEINFVGMNTPLTSFGKRDIWDSYITHSYWDWQSGQSIGFPQGHEVPYAFEGAKMVGDKEVETCGFMNCSNK